jgi:molybdopterin molybdotransferase
MDGYAVRYEDVQTCPVTLKLVEAIPAGDVPQHTLQPGQAARILTGAMMPTGADTVVMQEQTQREAEQITILQAPKPQEFVRKQGTYCQAGFPLLQPGIHLSAPEIAILAAAQCTAVPVFRRPKVAILSTGSELIEPDQPLGPGQIVDSNQYALTALVEQMGAAVIAIGIVPDQPEKLKAAIQQALTNADVVISSGGVSVGDYDYIDRLLEAFGATIHIRKIAVKPGKPLTFATQGSKLYFGLPGNPASALVTFWRFVQPTLRKLSGLAQGWGPAYLSAIATQVLIGGPRETYIWGQISLQQGQYTFQPAPGNQLSGNLINLAGTNALAIVPIGQSAIKAGEPVQVFMI